MRIAVRALGIGVASLVAAGLVALMAWGISHKIPVTALSGITRVQQLAPEFTLPQFDGGVLALSELRGQSLVINFWNPFCSPCRLEARGLERVWQAYKDRGVLLVGVESPMLGDSVESAEAYLREFGVTYPNVRDTDGRVTVDYGIIGLPVTFFVNREGVVERRWVGAIDEGRLLSWVDELASGVAPSEEVDGANLEGFLRLD